MKKKQIWWLLCCTFLSVVVISGLLILSPIKKKLEPGGFKRKHFADLHFTASMDLAVNSFYLAGVDDSVIYLGNNKAIAHVVRTNLSLSDSQHRQIQVMMDSVRKPDNFRLLINAPYFFMTNGVEPVILQGKIEEWVARTIRQTSQSHFVEAVPLSKSSFMVKCFNETDGRFELGKMQNDSVKLNAALLNKQVDGLFCLDGKLHYNKATNCGIYLHFYRNEFTVIDSMLRLQYRGHTIDTFTKVKIKVAFLKGGRERTMSRPPSPVNGTSCVFGNNLFVQSMILANNDDPERFLNSSTIDVYDLTTGRYTHTLYIPKFRNKFMQSFLVIGNKIFAICGNFLVRYDIESLPL